MSVTQIHQRAFNGVMR